MTKKYKGGRRKRSNAEKIWIAISIVLALAMVLSVLIPLFQSS